MQAAVSACSKGHRPWYRLLVVLIVRTEDRIAGCEQYGLQAELQGAGSKDCRLWSRLLVMLHVRVADRGAGYW